MVGRTDGEGIPRGISRQRDETNEVGGTGEKCLYRAGERHDRGRHANLRAYGKVTRTPRGKRESYDCRICPLGTLAHRTKAHARGLTAILAFTRLSLHLGSVYTSARRPNAHRTEESWSARNSWSTVEFSAQDWSEQRRRHGGGLHAATRLNTDSHLKLEEKIRGIYRTPFAVP